MPLSVVRANAAKSKVGVHVEPVFAQQKGPMALFVWTIGWRKPWHGQSCLQHEVARLLAWEAYGQNRQFSYSVPLPLNLRHCGIYKTIPRIFDKNPR